MYSTDVEPLLQQDAKLMPKMIAGSLIAVE
jgi:hypothetical protein